MGLRETDGEGLGRGVAVLGALAEAVAQAVEKGVGVLVPEHVPENVEAAELVAVDLRVGVEEPLRQVEALGEGDAEAMMEMLAYPLALARELRRALMDERALARGVRVG